MTANVSEWVWKHSRAQKSARLMLLAIAHESDRDGAAIISMPELAAKTLLSERSMQGAIAELMRLGELEVWARSGGHSRNAYRVIMDRGAESAPLGGAGYAPRHAARGAESAGAQNLRGAKAAGVRGAESAGVAPHLPRSDPGKPDTPPETPAKSAGVEKTNMNITTTGRSQADVKDVSEALARDDVERLCAHLADRIEANGSKRPAIGARWRQAARLMLDKDGFAEDQIIRAIDWCQDNEFWRANILSMPKLREKYHTLRLQAGRGRQNGHKPSTTDQRVAAAQALKTPAKGELE